jgi:cyclase
MEIHQITDRISAIISPSGGSNVGVIQTSAGYVVVDTKTKPDQIQKFLDGVKVSPADVCLVFVTHSHTDHSGGISLFKCPVLTHKITYQRILKREKSKNTQNLPTDYFEGTQKREIGGVEFEFIHTGGHTPGSSIVWIPAAKVLFSGDLLFGGRYPILAVARIPDLLKALRWLPTLNPGVIVPGHGHLYGLDQLWGQLEYIESTWKRTEEHISLGHNIEEVLKDDGYPRYADLGTNLHDGNIKAIYKQIKKDLRTSAKD